MLRNVSGQKWRVYAWDTTTGQAKTGDAANISAYITKDFGTPAATDDAAPTELSSTNQPGYYEFDLLAAETNAHTLSLAPKSGTSDIAVIPCPAVVNPIPQYLSLLGIASDGDLSGNLDGNVGGNVTGSVASVTGNVGGNVTGSVGSVTGGINTGSGTITTLDGLDTAQDTQHSTTQSAISGLNNLSSSDVQTAATASLNAYDPPTNTEMVAAFTEIKGATWSTTDTLEAIRDRGDSAWITATGFSTHSAADVWAVATRTLSAFSFDVTLATSQPNYAPAKAGDQMDLVNAPNATAVTAIQSGLSTYDGSDTSGTSTLLTRLSSARAGYLDNLNVSGVLAHTDNASSFMADISGLSTLDATGVRTAVGLASANLDTQLSALPTAIENADALLIRDLSNVDGTAATHSLYTKIMAGLESSVSGTTWTIYQTDGTTPHITRTVATSEGADPIVSVT